jgi:hypothetical protein
LNIHETKGVKKMGLILILELVQVLVNTLNGLKMEQKRIHLI